MERLTVKLNDGTWALKRNADESSISMAIARLAAYEGTGLEPAQIEQLKGEVFGLTVDKKELNEYQNVGSIDHLRELAQAEKDGRLMVLPFVAMVEQSLQNGEMTPKQDQRFNGRYAVVYVDKKKWSAPLIDICGRHYDREEAEKRLAELTREEAEAALKKREEECNEHDH